MPWRNEWEEGKRTRSEERPGDICFSFSFVCHLFEFSANLDSIYDEGNTENERTGTHEHIHRISPRGKGSHAPDPETKCKKDGDTDEKKMEDSE